MRRGVILGAAILVAAVAAIPLWLVLDDGGVRRLGSLDPTTVHGSAGRLTFGTGAPIPIDSFSLNVARPVGAAQPETDSISVTFSLFDRTPALVGRAVGSTKPDPAKIELVRSGGGTSTVYLTVDLTNVSIESLEDFISTENGRANGTAEITLRYDSMTVTCTTAVCGQPIHAAGHASDILIPDLGDRAVVLESGAFAVPKAFQAAKQFSSTVTMGPTYLLVPLIARAKDGRTFEKTIQADLYRNAVGEEAPRKFATYKLAGTVVTSLGVSVSNELPVVSFQLASRRVGVYGYTYTNAGVLEKTNTFCWDADKAAAGCTGL
jgi:type VI protein secretion system component Hcp